MADLMADGLDWFAEKFQDFVSREVSYRGIRDGVTIIATVTASLGSSQLTQINALGTDPGIGGFMLAPPIETDRDYIVKQEDLRGEGLWPPEQGDMIDDTNDVDGLTYRYRVMGIPGQASWRGLAGSYGKMARVHTKFYKELTELWSDAFTAANGTALSSHIPDSPSTGSYGGGSGAITISTNRIVAGAASAYRFFTHGGTEQTETRINLSLNGIATADLDGKYAELGVGIRCATSGAGLRDGYYCLLRVGYTGTLQSTKQLRIVEVSGGIETLKASKTLSAFLSRSSEYQLVVFDDGATITLGLADSTGDVSQGSVAFATTTYAGNAAAAVRFNHEATLASYATPYLDTLTVDK